MIRISVRSLLQLSIVAAIVFMVAGGAVALDPKPHPLFGNKILGQSAEIAAVWPGATGTACGMGMYDFLSGSVTPWGHYIFGDVRHDYPQQDIVAGDFDGDGDDEIAVAYRIEPLPDANLIGVVMMDVDHGDLTCISVDTLWFGWLKDYWVTKWETTYLRLFTGNFDSDSTVELGLIYCDVTEPQERIIIKVIDWQEGDGLVEVADIEVDAVDDPLCERLVFDAASGDFDGDGIDEIVAAGGKKQTSTHFMVYLKTYEVLLDENRLELTAVDTPYVYPQSGEVAGEGCWVDRIALATGDMTGNTLDEIALAFEHVHAFWIWGVVSNYHLKSTGHLHTYRMSADLDTVLAMDSDSYYLGDEVKANCSWAEYYHPYISGRGMGVAIGDLNLDGREDLIWVVKDVARVYRNSAQGELTYDTYIPYDNHWEERSWKIVTIADLDADPADSIWCPEVILGDWGGGSEYYRIRAFQMAHDPDGVFTGATEIPGTVETSTTRYASMVTGDFNGSSVRLGEPTATIITEVPQPVVILKAPPIHYDIFDGTIFNVNDCYGDPVCDIYTSYSQTAGSEKLSTTTLKRDWGVGANISGEYTAMGIGVKTQMKLKYGEEFSKEQTVAETFTVSTNYTAYYADVLCYKNYGYKIWEYPIYCDSTLQEQRILVVVPYLSEVPWQWLNVKNPDATFYTPNHEAGNLMSYYYYGELENNPDMAQKIYAETGLDVSPYGFADLEILYGRFTGEVDYSSRKAEIEIGASISAYGLEVGVEGNYGQERFTTHSTTVSDDICLLAHVGMITLDDQQYLVTPYIYWAKNGALVVDYAMNPNGDFYVEHYGQTCDPTFICLWRYDLEKGFGDPGTQKYETRDIKFMPSHPEPGDTVTITARIYNFSLVETPLPVDARFYVGDPDVGGEIISDTAGYTDFSTDGTIGPRSYREIDLVWEVPEDIPYYPEIYAVLDPFDMLGEVHETNNKGYNILPVEGIVTSIEEISETILPDAFKLSTNYPNPFNPATEIEFALPKSCPAKLEIFNILGQRVTTLVDRQMEAGYHKVTWDGARFASGIYLYRLQAGDFVESKKMMLVK